MPRVEGVFKKMSREDGMSLLNETQRIAQELGIRPARTRGQNFVVDERVIKAMIKAAELSPADHALEVGGGLGTLTRALCETGSRVTVVEIDASLAAHLASMTVRYPHLRIVKDDILAVNIRELMEASYKIVASLPYNITSRFFRTILEHQVHPERLVVLVQKEVAERVTARPGKMSILAVSVQYFGEASILAAVSSASFWPRPRVDSAILRVVPHKHEKHDPIFTKKFFRVVRSGFSSPRKKLINNLHAAFQTPKEGMESLFRAVNLLPTCRAQELSVEQWKFITQNFDASGAL